MGKSINTSQVNYIDNNPTQITTEKGVINPDKSGRVKLAYMKDGSRQWLCDKEKISLEDGFAVSTGQDKIANKVGTFSGIGEGKLRKAYETEEEYQQRMEMTNVSSE